MGKVKTAMPLGPAVFGFALLLLNGACGDTRSSPIGEPAAQTSDTAIEAPLVKQAEGRTRDVGLSYEIASDSATTSTTVTATLRNNGNQTVHVLKRGTPWDRYSAPFNVSLAGNAIAYVGYNGYYLGVTDDDFLRLEAGQTSTTTYPLSKNYELAPNQTHEVTPSSSILQVRVDGQVRNLQHDAPSIRVAHETPETAKAVQPLTFSRCDGVQQTLFTDAKNISYRMIRSVVEPKCGGYAYTTACNGVPLESYKSWFGAWTLGRENTVWQNFWATGSNGPNWDDLTLSCESTCGNPNLAAYSSYHENVIHTCPIFWDSTRILRSLSADNSANMPGIILHEMTHNYANTLDWTYEKDPCLNLAATSPDDAIRNADNYSLFASTTYVSIIDAPVSSTLLL